MSEKIKDSDSGTMDWVTPELVERLHKTIYDFITEEKNKFCSKSDEQNDEIVEHLFTSMSFGNGVKIEFKDELPSNQQCASKVNKSDNKLKVLHLSMNVGSSEINIDNRSDNHLIPEAICQTAEELTKVNDFLEDNITFSTNMQQAAAMLSFKCETSEHVIEDISQPGSSDAMLSSKELLKKESVVVVSSSTSTTQAKEVHNQPKQLTKSSDETEIHVYHLRNRKVPRILEVKPKKKKVRSTRVRKGLSKSKLDKPLRKQKITIAQSVAKQAFTTKYLKPKIKDISRKYSSTYSSNKNISNYRERSNLQHAFDTEEMNVECNSLSYERNSVSKSTSSLYEEQRVTTLSSEIEIKSSDDDLHANPVCYSKATQCNSDTITQSYCRNKQLSTRDIGNSNNHSHDSNDIYVSCESELIQVSDKAVGNEQSSEDYISSQKPKLVKTAKRKYKKLANKYKCPKVLKRAKAKKSKKAKKGKRRYIKKKQQKK